MKLTIAGCGDAFGSGGRLQTCYHVDTGGKSFLIDCGATALLGLNRLRLDPSEIETIFISHLHGDHYAGLVWWILHAQHVARRSAPLTVVGPPGLEQRYLAAAEALFPGTTKLRLRFPLKFVEIPAEERVVVDGIAVIAREVLHPSGAPSYALRFDLGSRTLAFSGDTEWVDTLLPTASGADLFIVECFGYETAIATHMNWKIIEANLARLAARRYLLVHMSEEMLANQHRIDRSNVIAGEDGLSIVF